MASLPKSIPECSLLKTSSSSSDGSGPAPPRPARGDGRDLAWHPHPPPLPGSSPSKGSLLLGGSLPGSFGALQKAGSGSSLGASGGGGGAQAADGAAPGGIPISRSSSAAADVLSAGSGLLLPPTEGAGDDAPGGRSPCERRRCPFVIGVAGGTASGKTTVCDQIIQRLHDQCVVMLNQDSFYRSLTEEELRDVANYNFDHPNAFDTPALLACLDGLKAGRAVEVPTYDFAAHRRGTETRKVEPADVIVVEGILVLHMEELRSQCNMNVYVDTDDDVRLARRIQRDVQARGRDVAGVIEQYTRFVKPAFDQFVAPSRRYADIIIPWQRGDNLVAIDLITQHIALKLRCHDLLRIYPNLELLPSNFQIRGMHTIIRDASSSKNDFVFYADRLNRLIVEAGLGHLPFTEKIVRTPTGHRYVGVDFTRGICGVSIIRSGEAMETALRECCQGIKLGKILVHRHGPAAAEQEVIYERLPADIASRHVLLLDPLVGTGRTACRAVQVLLERGVAAEKILFLSMVAAPEAIHRLCSAYPGMKFLTSEIDRGLDDACRIVPGIGDSSGSISGGGDGGSGSGSSGGPAAALRLGRRQLAAAAAAASAAAAWRPGVPPAVAAAAAAEATLPLVPSIPLSPAAPDLRVSRVIKGCWQLSGGHRGERDTDRTGGKAAVDDFTAFDQAGITTWDAADHYGPAELLIGRWLAEHPDARPRVQVATKYCVFSRAEMAALDGAAVRAAVERSRKRLGVDRIDLLQLYWGDYSQPRYVDAALHLTDLAAAGVIGAVGVTNFDVPRLERMLDAGARLASNQVQYSLLDARPENGMAALCAARGLSLLPYGVVAGGLLSDRYLGAATADVNTYSKGKYAAVLGQVGGWEWLQGLLRALRGAADKHGTSIANVAARWVLQRPGVPAVIVGARNASHVGDHRRLFTFELDADDLAAIDAARAAGRRPRGDCYDWERGGAWYSSSSAGSPSPPPRGGRSICCITASAAAAGSSGPRALSSRCAAASRRAMRPACHAGSGLSLALLALAGALCALLVSGGGTMLGGPAKAPITARTNEVGEFAVEQLNAKANFPKAGALRFGKVVSARTQVVSGTNHILVIEASDDAGPKTVEVTVWEKLPCNVKANDLPMELTNFKLVGPVAE
ncbi:UKL1 [Scenedesmus sp. PABB004]|nr:UKL1 [Scenedesmus sp. PABB004]